MRRIVIVVLAVSIVLLGVGYSRGWWFVTSGRAVDGNQVNVKLTLDPDKTKSDGKQMLPYK